ncbi:unnamed protein product [Phytophthora lilii]|uniref:Unnamed protein product n=1 Tax=Phytophthora lilii TaxID=2077276 RepID=A0A9W6U149_9STRA|nr:unnamed protein product [Phytophthora lilii]
MLFAQYRLNCSQVLASDADFREPKVRENLKRTLRTLLDVGIIPVINENDVITRRTAPLVCGDKMAWDNDSLASLFAQEMRANLMVLITDVDGIYTASSSTGEDRKLILRFQRDDKPFVAPDLEFQPWVRKTKFTRAFELWTVEVFGLRWSRRPGQGYFVAFSTANAWERCSFRQTANLSEMQQRKSSKLIHCTRAFQSKFKNLSASSRQLTLSQNGTQQPIRTLLLSKSTNEKCTQRPRNLLLVVQFYYLLLTVYYLHIDYCRFLYDDAVS